MKFFNQQLPLIGLVTYKNLEKRVFRIQTRSGDSFDIHVNSTTWFDSVKNLDLSLIHI